MARIGVRRYVSPVVGLGLTIVAAPAGTDRPNITFTAALLAWILAVPMYLVTRYIDAAAHEGGHAIIATLLFQKVTRIELYANGEGGTTYAQPVPWPLSILTGAAGYLGPSMFGLLAIPLLLHGAVQAVLVASLAFLFLMLLVVRGPFGLVFIPALIGLIFWIAFKVKPPVQVLYAHMWVWFLLIAPVEEMLAHIEGQVFNNPKADTAKLQQRTLLPSALWALALLVGTIAALVFGGSLLLRHAF
jgi:Peptidase M50B-like